MVTRGEKRLYIMASELLSHLSESHFHLPQSPGFEMRVVSSSPILTSAAPVKAIFTTLRSAISLGKHK